MSGAYEIECPHDACTESLHVVWALTYTLSPDETTVPAPFQADCATWQVECSAGHVVLLPDHSPCCDDPEGPFCAHDPEDYDWSDETSTLRFRDLLRLRTLIHRLTTEASP